MYMVNCISDEFLRQVSENKITSMIIPIGSVEAHGHHLPLGTDIFSPELFCRMIEERMGNEIWIAPGIPYGQSYDLSIYPGTVHVPSTVMADYVYHVCKSMHANGINSVVFLNGHGGNVNALNLASERLVELQMSILTINWWMDYATDILKITEGQGHGGEDETSAILFYDERLVDMKKAMHNQRIPLMRAYYPGRGASLYENALSGDATMATLEKGQRIFDILSDKIVDTIRLFQQGIYYTEQQR